MCALPFQDGLGLLVQPGLAAAQDQKCLQLVLQQWEQRGDTVPGGAAAPALHTHTPHGARG